MTSASLQKYTCKDLAQMARRQGVAGWHSMRKDQLIKALLREAKSKANRTKRTGVGGRNGMGRSTSNGTRLGQKTVPSKAQQRIDQFRSKLERLKNLATSGNETPVETADRLVVMVRDPYWLHAYWELSPHGIQRAQAAMGQHWHTAQPVLRLFEVSDQGAARLLRSVEIHGGVNHWYLDVQDPPQQYQLDIGYLAADGNFHRLARSNRVSTPRPGMRDAVDENWTDVADNADRIFAMSGGYTPNGTSQELQEVLEERLRRPLGSPMTTRFGSGAGDPQHSPGGFQLAVDAELVVFGATLADAHVTLNGEPVQLRTDGTFAVRLDMPDRRQVIPIVSSTSDGVEQRTVILAIERNTKVLEPVVRDGPTQKPL